MLFSIPVANMKLAMVVSPFGAAPGVGSRANSRDASKEKPRRQGRVAGIFRSLGRRMLGPEGFIAVDWGTTNRRAYRVGRDGRCSDEFEDGRGVLSVGAGAF